MRRGNQTVDTRQMEFELPLGPYTDAELTWETGVPEVVEVAVAPHTGEPAGIASPDNGSPWEPSPERAYPHIYDEGAGEGGAAMSLIAQAKQEVAAAVDAWSIADLQEVSGRLAQLAATLAAAHRHTHFNESLGAVVSFVRRAALNTMPDDIGIANLMLLAQSLNALYEQPMITLDGATDLIEKLQSSGWNGQHEDVDAFVRALLGSSREPASSESEAPAHTSQE